MMFLGPNLIKEYFGNTVCRFGVRDRKTFAKLYRAEQ